MGSEQIHTYRWVVVSEQELDFGRAADHVNGDRMLTLIDAD